MTSPAEPASTDATEASQLTKPLRELAAFVLLGANAVFLFVGLIRLLTPTEYVPFAGRAGSAFSAFVGMEAAALPVLAVLLATHVRPTTPKAKLITQVALGEYAFSALLGALTFLVWTVDLLAAGEVLEAFTGLLVRVAWLALLGLGAFVVFKIWRTLYFVPSPKPQPGVYGQPQPGWPQQGGYPAPGQPGQPIPGQPGQPIPGQPGQPIPGQQGAWQAPGPYGAPYGQQPAPFGGPQATPPFTPAPQSGPPAAAAPQSAPPFGSSPTAPPFGPPPSAEPTQAIPRQSVEPTQAIPRPTDGEPDHTQRINPGEYPDAPR
ncbi:MULTISPECIES: hypothetical protein [unclassified Micromonospora]|uniref:hypothetical protein n=1 Tax=unclassified Micromonospora TaxID=2617518 RepID=UPI0033302245